jgi:hypothetical protein
MRQLFTTLGIEIPVVLFRVNNNGRPKTDQQSSNEASETVREACS